ncbi:MAG: T9SS type A sorting domain-containing protein [Fibrobacteria bacterium]|nr:T9SS type A sorting domain-containing protein [Fibrobacteria bacterium]
MMTSRLLILDIIILFVSLILVEAKFPTGKLVMMDISQLRMVTSKEGPSDSRITFEEVMETGINGLHYRGWAGSGRQYSYYEWVQEAREYGFWVCGASGSHDGQAGRIDYATNIAAHGVDFMTIDLPFVGWGDCSGVTEPFLERDFNAMKQAAQNINPDLPVLITDPSCNHMFYNWQAVDGLFQVAFWADLVPRFLDSANIYKAMYPEKPIGIWTWINAAHPLDPQQRLPDSDFAAQFPAAYNHTNVIMFIWNRRDLGEPGGYGTNWSERVKVLKENTGGGVKLPEWRNFSPTAPVALSAPDCQVQVRSSVSGLNPASVECYYTIYPMATPWSPASKWIKHKDVVCTGVKGTTDWVTITANRVPFLNSDSSFNRVMFKIADNYSGNLYQGPRTFKREYAVNISRLDWSGLTPGGIIDLLTPDLSINIQNGSGLNISSVVCEYTTDGGTTWSIHPAQCTGTEGSTAKETVTVKAVPFTEDVAKKNKIRFQINTNGRDTLKSAEYAVKVHIPPRFYHLTVSRNGAISVDLRLKVDEPAGLCVGSQEVPVREETMVLLHLNGNVKDVSGNGFDGSLHNGITFKSTTSWKSGSAQEQILYFDGVNDYVDMGLGDLGLSYELTLSAWVKAENSEVGLALGGVEGNGSLLVSMLSDQVSVKGRSNVPENFALSSPAGTFSHNEWHHLAVTYDGTTMKIYVDGNLKADTEWTNYKIFRFKPFRLGMPANRGRFFKGYIDEVHLVSRVLTESEIASDYYSGIYRYSTDGGGSWSSWGKGVIDVADGSTQDGTMSVSGVPFSQKADSSNRVQFAARDLNGNTGSRELIITGEDVFFVAANQLKASDVKMLPNPFQNQVNISFKLKNAGWVEVSLYDLHGSKVKMFFYSAQAVGQTSLSWDGKNMDGVLLPAGQYIVQINSASGRVTKKIVFLGR